MPTCQAVISLQAETEAGRSALWDLQAPTTLKKGYAAVLSLDVLPYLPARRPFSPSEANSGTARVFRSAEEQDKLAVDVVSTSGQYDDQFGISGQMVTGDRLNIMFKEESRRVSS